jgi:hypothetical protein
MTVWSKTRKCFIAILFSSLLEDMPSKISGKPGGTAIK